MKVLLVVTTTVCAALCGCKFSASARVESKPSQQSATETPPSSPSSNHSPSKKTREDTSCDVKEPNCDPVSQLAYDNLHAILGEQDSSTVMVIERDDGTYLPAYKDRLEGRARKLDSLEKWARALPAPYWQAYLGWIDYYRDGVNKSLAEWHSHEERDHQIEFERHQRECELESQRYAGEHPVPKPPEE